MRKVILFIASNLDKSIVREHGETDWLIDSEGGEGVNVLKNRYILWKTYPIRSGILVTG